MTDTKQIMERLQQLLAQQNEERTRADKAQKLEAYRRLNRYAKHGQVVFAGSSLMEMFPINELLMDFDLPYTIYNRGIGGWTTEEMLLNLGPCILELEPRWLFLNIGTNDLNRSEYNVTLLMERYAKILHAVRNALPDVQIFMLAYYPVNATVGMRHPTMTQTFLDRTNARIEEANRHLQVLAKEEKCRYLDLNEGLRDDDGNLKANYTIEGLHMYADGYKQVLNTLLPVLQTLHL